MNIDMSMGCKCAKFDSDSGRYECSITGECVYMIPNSKRCAEEYGEGPDAPVDESVVIIREEEEDVS